MKTLKVIDNQTGQTTYVDAPEFAASKRDLVTAWAKFNGRYVSKCLGGYSYIVKQTFTEDSWIVSVEDK